jgi:hypothetical protein
MNVGSAYVKILVVNPGRMSNEVES